MPTTKADLTKVSLHRHEPGWHITTGPVHAIFYRPEPPRPGNYTATLDAFFFGPPGQYPEGYGIFVGGKDLAGPNQSYLYFVAANNGKFLIKKRTGATTATVVDWTASPAIKTVPAGDKCNVENVFKIQARPGLGTILDQWHGGRDPAAQRTGGRWHRRFPDQSQPEYSRRRLDGGQGEVDFGRNS